MYERSHGGQSRPTGHPHRDLRVFIANEGSDAALSSHLASTEDADIDDIEKLRALSFARTAFDPDKDIPMVRQIRQVKVIGNNSVQTPAMSAPQTGIWTVGLEKAAIRLRLSIEMTGRQYDLWESPQQITIEGIAGEAYVLPQIDNSATQQASGEAFAAAIGGTGPGVITESETSDSVTITYDRLILPELLLSTDNNIEANAMTLSMAFSTRVKSGIISAPAGDEFGYALPRNTYLQLNAAVKEDYLDIDAVVLPWGTSDHDVTSDGQYNLHVDQTEYYFNSYGSPQPINVTTDYPDGWTAESSDAGWATLPTQADNSVGAQAYAGTTPRTGTITIVAGNMHKTIHVTQFPPVNAITDAVIPNSYVGAFWKADQTGERLINIPTGAGTGQWTAIVAEGEDWIHLDTLMTSDQNVGWRTDLTPDETNVDNGNDPGFDMAHIVAGNYKHAGGATSSSAPGIYFRIGLNGTHTPSAGTPARYGVVILAYAGNTKLQRIWIRQGEGADYVFGGGGERQHAAQFSPYNLTGAGMSGTTTESVQVPATTDGGGVFTDYPSQVGAQFIWARVSGNDKIRYAYNSFKAEAPSQWGVAGRDMSNYWDALSSENETCPEGYRRPTDGPTNAVTDMTAAADIELSEMRQSLFETPPTGEAKLAFVNNAWGYYADGFFDRRQLQTSPGGIVGTNTSSPDSTAVSILNNDIACMGWIHFNPATGASLFFPAAGYRGGNSTPAGAMQNLGTFGYYMTSTTTTVANNIWSLHNGNLGTVINMWTGWTRSNSGSIRCVYDKDLLPPDPVDPDDAVDSPGQPITNQYVGAFWKADQTGERLINITRPTSGSADGKWTAQVIAGQDWITLDKTMTSDQNVGWRTDVTPDEEIVDNGNDADFDTNHPVGGTWWVRGNMNSTAPNDKLYFRIGLKSTLSGGANAAPRYGIVLLTYGDGAYTQRIWIRQGEGADYLMAPGDPNGSGIHLTDDRESAVRFSPYNLTDPARNDIADYNAMVDASTGLLPFNGGTWTDYPTQAGYSFQFGYPRAFKPFGTFSNWTIGKKTWEAETDETCPPGFRRPATIVSELAPSLQSDGIVADLSNSVWGNYADGFFDRRKIVSNYKVAANSPDVAYLGRLYFNPGSDSYASLFFPAAGNRANGSGTIINESIGLYWTSDALSYLVLKNNAVYGNITTASDALYIRCVKEDLVVGKSGINLDDDSWNGLE